MREIDEIIIHATATNPSWMTDKPVEDVVAEIRRWHVEERKWSDIGYHAVIHRDGSVGYGSLWSDLALTLAVETRQQSVLV